MYIYIYFICKLEGNEAKFMFNRCVLLIYKISHLPSYSSPASQCFYSTENWRVAT